MLPSLCCCSSFQRCKLSVAGRKLQVARGELLHIFLYKPTEMQQIFMATRERVKNKKKRKGKKPETWKAKLWPRGSRLIRLDQGSIYRAGQLYPIAGSGRCRSHAAPKKSIECPVLHVQLELSSWNSELLAMVLLPLRFLLNQSSSTCSAALARSQRMWLQIYSSFCFQLF